MNLSIIQNRPCYSYMNYPCPSISIELYLFLCQLFRLMTLSHKAILTGFVIYMMSNKIKEILLLFFIFFVNRGKKNIYESWPTVLLIKLIWKGSKIIAQSDQIIMTMLILPYQFLTVRDIKYKRKLLF